MAGSANWLDQLEARLEQTLESFLQANPQQETLLAEQEARERQQQLRRDRLALKAEAEIQRQGLLRLAEDIRCWQERVDRAKAASALDLAGRAEAHIATLMEQGRARWQTLDELGERFAAVERELQQLGRTPNGPATGAAATTEAPSKQDPSGPDLEADWAAFETQQELDALRRKMQG
ncbi:MAG: hercynine metabolism protein [Cyanobacteriota bacterium]|jgi:hercynine metabolism protein|nr:hercynine metabolism protein [Cyanobacteriota bacterium]